MLYYEKNKLWNQNSKIRAKFSRLAYEKSNYIYVGILYHSKPWTACDYIDIMSYYDCNGYEVITEQEAKENSSIPTSGYQVFLKLEKRLKTK